MRHDTRAECRPVSASRHHARRGNSQRNRRSAAPDAAKVALGLLLANAGCTLTAWQDAWWPPERVHACRIEAGSFDGAQQLHLRIARTQGAAQVHVAAIERWENVEWYRTPPEWAWLPMTVVDGHDLPASAVPVRVVEEGGLDSYLRSVDTGSQSESRVLLVELQPGTYGQVDTVWALDSLHPSLVATLVLPDPPIAWLSGNVLGHVAAMPVTVATDVLLSPLYLTMLLLEIAGVHLGH